MNSQQLKSKLNQVKVNKASFGTDETGETINSFFRELSIDGQSISLKFSGTLNSPPKYYENNFGNHISMAVKLDSSTVQVLNGLVVRLYEGCPDDEEWTSKAPVNDKNVIVIKLGTKNMKFRAEINGSNVSPMNLDVGLEVGSKVQVTANLGCWYMMNRENKYGISINTKSIVFGDQVSTGGRKKKETTVIEQLELADEEVIIK